MNTDQIVAKVEAIERHRHTIVQRFTLRGSDGKEYGASLPRGVTCLGRGSAYWVFQTLQGTTVGKRYASEADALAANEAFAKGQGDEMRQALAGMSPEQLQAQSDYWETQ